MRKLLALAMLALAGWAAWQQRTARVIGARATQLDGPPARAEVVLSFSSGPRPASLIVDLHGQSGPGSSTIAGDEDMAMVPISGPLGSHHTITVTASSRIGGRLFTRTSTFAPERIQRNDT
ncbi:MAG: hypothetical protein H7Z42_01450 [Roseiflexaceae bacterium]|nr:hypothetical protein [Roseiflexaceae bacterium]